MRSNCSLIVFFLLNSIPFVIQITALISFIYISQSNHFITPYLDFLIIDFEYQAGFYIFKEGDHQGKRIINNVTINHIFLMLLRFIIICHNHVNRPLN